MNKSITIGAAVVGVALVILGIYYWLTPAGSLPHFLPGYQAGSVHVHFKHGLAAVILAALAFIFVWFASNKKESTN